MTIDPIVAGESPIEQLRWALPAEIAICGALSQSRHGFAIIAADPTCILNGGEVSMEGTDRASRDKEKLPLILAASVVQGWVLCGLHESIKNHHWPATHHTWLAALYALTVFVPLSAQVTADYARRAALWWMMTSLGAAVFYFGWHWGSDVSDPSNGNPDAFESVFALAFPLGILWLMALPFAQCYLSTGRWVSRYDSLFTFAWRNKLVLAEAALFTGLFWLLLTLWQTLFHMLRIDFFRELFREPIFVYPVTSLAFGCALHLMDPSIDSRA